MRRKRKWSEDQLKQEARLAQLVERETFNLKAKGSSPLSGGIFLVIIKNIGLHFCICKNWKEILRFSQKEFIKT